MKPIWDLRKQELALQLFYNIHSNELEYVYRGYFSTAVTDNILLLTENTLSKADLNHKFKKRIFFLLVEGLQNITRHQNMLQNNSAENAGIFAINRFENNYLITTGNLIHNHAIDDLKSKIDKINSLKKEELKQFYIETLSQGDLSEKGGAGLGLIEMARKAGKLQYAFRQINDSCSFFYLHLNVWEDEDIVETKNSEKTLQNITELHKVLNDENILLTFKGVFTQDNLLNLLSIVEAQIQQSSLSIKVFNVMVEILQNIVKHASKRLHKLYGVPGVFFIYENEKEYLLTAGNYVKNSEIEGMTERIEHVNKLTDTELDAYYNRILLDKNQDDAETAGLGFIDIRLKCRNELRYTFEETNNRYSLFVLQVPISKSFNGHSLQIEASKDTPFVHIDPWQRNFIIKGRSLPEDALSFYAPIIKWIEENLNSTQFPMVFDFSFEHINTHSSKQIIKLLLLLKQKSEGKKIKVNWYYRKIDFDMQETGIRFAKVLETIPFELRPI